MDEPAALIAIVITRDEARVWAGLAPGTEPTRLRAPDPRRDIRHGRKTARHQGYEVNHEVVALFDDVAASTADASTIILLGHGTGKASAMEEMLEHWRAKHPGAADKVVTTIDVNLSGMSDAQLLAAAREWWDAHRDFVE